MKIQLKKVAFFAGLLLLMGSAACAQKGNKRGENKAAMANEMDSISYVFGSSLGQNIRQAEIEGVNTDALLQGVIDAMESDEALKISMADGNNMVREFMTRQQAQQAEKSMAKANDYMAEKSKDNSYTATESGILYKVIEKGDGPKPVATDEVKVNYEGKTTDGKVFDSSYERGQPAEFPLNRVIPGWTEMLQLMETGSTVEAILPPGLAYGERGSPPNIGPNEVLIFKIELIEILNK